MKKIGILIFLCALAFGIFISSNCSLVNPEKTTNGESGSGKMATEQRNVSDFSEIKASNAVKIEVSVQKSFSVVVVADDNLIKNVITEVKGEVLEISTKDNTRSQAQITVRVGMPELNNLEVSGASEALVTDIKGNRIDLSATGASKITISGEVQNLEANATGASEINAEGLKSETADVEATGASSATVNTFDTLTAEATGASSVIYIGDPKTLNQNSSGASSIKKK